MEAEDVKALLEAHLESCEVFVEGGGSSFQITAVGSLFEGLNAVKKQQCVYAALNEKIADGTIHAVTIKTYTPAEWAAQ
ncbi:MAG: BolA family protein [Pseudomonadales bacterium]|jgi:acid stress-induced BolA-like protein IbaG/YrbA